MSSITQSSLSKGVFSRLNYQEIIIVIVTTVVTTVLFTHGNPSLAFKFKMAILFLPFCLFFQHIMASSHLRKNPHVWFMSVAVFSFFQVNNALGLAAIWDKPEILTKHPEYWKPMVTSLLVYLAMIIFYFTVATRFVMEKDRAILLNDALITSGEHFRFWSFFDSRVTRLYHTIELTLAIPSDPLLKTTWIWIPLKITIDWSTGKHLVWEIKNGSLWKDIEQKVGDELRARTKAGETVPEYASKVSDVRCGTDVKSLEIEYITGTATIHSKPPIK